MSHSLVSCTVSLYPPRISKTATPEGVTAGQCEKRMMNVWRQFPSTQRRDQLLLLSADALAGVSHVTDIGD